MDNTHCPTCKHSTLLLKGCPLCGGEAVIVPTINTPQLSFIRCENCSLSTGISKHEDIVNLWNQRPYENV